MLLPTDKCMAHVLLADASAKLSCESILCMCNGVCMSLPICAFVLASMCAHVCACPFVWPLALMGSCKNARLLYKYVFVSVHACVHAREHAC